MKINRRWLAVVAGAALALIAPAAMADTVYNDLDGSVDSSLEQLDLTYDSVAMTGSSGTTTLEIQVDGHPDHPGCNINGARYITLAPVLSDPAVATVSLSNGGTFDACSDTVLATVQATGIGSTDVTFTVTASKLDGDWHTQFSLVEAAFTVNVTEGSTPLPPPVGCDADPAAPAWANAILAKAGLKPKMGSTNLVSLIAHEMGNGATFGGYAKNAHPQYENAVHDELEALTGKTLPSAQSAARPGWECSAQTS
jgi:hypothetical protein